MWAGNLACRLAGGTVENPSGVGRTPWSAAGPLASLPRFVEGSGNAGFSSPLVARRAMPTVRIGCPTIRDAESCCVMPAELGQALLACPSAKRRVPQTLWTLCLEHDSD